MPSPPPAHAPALPSSPPCPCPAPSLPRHGPFSWPSLPMSMHHPHAPHPPVPYPLVPHPYVSHPYVPHPRALHFSCSHPCGLTGLSLPRLWLTFLACVTSPNSRPIPSTAHLRRPLVDFDTSVTRLPPGAAKPRPPHSSTPSRTPTLSSDPLAPNGSAGSRNPFFLGGSDLSTGEDSQNDLRGGVQRVPLA